MRGVCVRGVVCESGVKGESVQCMRQGPYCNSLNKG